MTLADIQAAIYEEANYGSSPATAVTTRITRWINEGIRTLLAEPGLMRLADSDGPFTLASVASQARYVLPESVSRIQSITERTNDYQLQAMSWDAYRRIEPDPASVTGTPTHYVPRGRVAVAVQPSDASEIFVDSTSAADTTQTAFIEGIVTGGYMRTASVTLTGTTAVTLSASITSFIEITDFYLSAVAAGTVTLHEDASGGELARITIGQKRPRYQAIYLWPTPAAAIDYLVDYRRELVDLANAADEPPLPTDYHQMLVAYGVMREAEFQGLTERTVMAKARYDRLLTRLKYQTQTSAGEIPVMGRAGRVGHSRLGAWFPADSWR